MLELFSRKPDGIDLRDDQTVVPIAADGAAASLSAILLDDTYYELIQQHAEVRDGVRMATASVLVPLKARAWLNLSERKANGGNVDQKDVDKHRTDVFRLAATLPAEAGPILPDLALDELRRFVGAFPDDAKEWPAILESLKTTFSGTPLRPAELRLALETFFRLA